MGGKTLEMNVMVYDSSVYKIASQLTEKTRERARWIDKTSPNERKRAQKKLCEREILSQIFALKLK